MSNASTGQPVSPRQVQFVVLDYGLSSDDDVAVAGPFATEEDAYESMRLSGHRFGVVPLWTPADLADSLAANATDNWTFTTLDPTPAALPVVDAAAGQDHACPACAPCTCGHAAYAHAGSGCGVLGREGRCGCRKTDRQLVQANRG